MRTDSFNGGISVCPPNDPKSLPSAERYRLFGEELDALKQRTLARLGGDDVAYIRRMDRFARRMELAGRALIHVSLEPVTFFLGVGALWVNKQLQATEIGHSALHGAWDGMPGAEKFTSKTFRWDTPVDEASWRRGHNVRHHGSTNVAARDPDIHFGPVRLTEQTPYSPWNSWAVPFTVAWVFPNFLFVIGSHVAGLNDVFFDNGRPEKLDFLPDRSEESVRDAWKRALRKYVPYYVKNYFVFPALAGPFFGKVLFGNWLAETMRDVYSAATIFCGHVGGDVKSWPAGTRARGRGEWYAMQVEATNDFEVSLPVSILCGGLDRQIEHHLFPTLPPSRLREIAPEVRAICERYGVKYKTDTWGKTLYKVFSHIARLSRKGGVREVMHAMT
ncbi:fatty acid desaturase [Sorangium sp. So ce260]|uniref:fatty acid desaturase family protein n=1 Tax=Sorangium sp. So ce260 TaxID=3133291 RepID=UPI003F647A05